MRHASAIAWLHAAGLLSAPLMAGPPPFLSRRPLPQRVLAGHSFSLTAGTSDPSALVWWEKDGQALPGQRAPLLRFPRALPGDTGTYRMLARNDLAPTEPGIPVIGESASPGVPVTVVVPPESPGVVDWSFEAPDLPLDKVHAVSPTADGGAVIACKWNPSGSPSRHAAVKLREDGSRDPSFQHLPGTDRALRAIVPHHDGWIVGGEFTSYHGRERPAIARLRHDGSLDENFLPPSPLAQSTLPLTVTALAIQQVDGEARILVGLNRSPGLLRLHPDGRPDTAFNNTVKAAGLAGQVNALAVDARQRIVLGGSFAAKAPWPFLNLGRLTPHGTPDPTFSSSGDRGPGSGIVESIALDADQRLLVAGTFGAVQGNDDHRYIARFSSDGALDAEFTPEPNSTVAAVACLPDGSLMVGGRFDRIAGQSGQSLIRLEATGHVAPEWHSASFNGDVTCLAVGLDGRVFVGGDFESPRPRFVAIRGTPFAGPIRFLPGVTRQRLVAGMGGSVVVAAQAPPSSRYHWIKEGQAGPAAVTQTGEWIIPVVQPSDGGTYRIDIVHSGPAGEVRHPGPVLEVEVESPSPAARPHRRVAATGLPRSIDTGKTMALDFPLLSPPNGVEEVRVTLALQHVKTGDLRISLTAPGGKTVPLFGLSDTIREEPPHGQSFHYAVFADSAAVSIHDAGSPYVGTFRPINSPFKLADLAAPRYSGHIWSLTIYDDDNSSGISRGSVHFAALDFFGKAPALDAAFVGRHALPPGEPELQWNAHSGEVRLRHWQPSGVAAACYDRALSFRAWEPLPPEVLYFMRREDDQTVQALLRLAGPQHPPDALFRARWSADHAAP